MRTVAVIIVGYRNADDIADCLHALAAGRAEPSFDVFIAENGGVNGMDALIAKLDAADPAWRRGSVDAAPVRPSNARRTANYQLVRPNGDPAGGLVVAEMSENLGYAGGVNAWLRPLLGLPGWDAAWMLNPDTEPQPDALAELAAYAREHGKGMVGSCIIRVDQPDLIVTRGLEWQMLLGRVKSIDRAAPSAVVPDTSGIEARMWAPSGASVYATRALIESIGLMDEHYFLYFEDFEWGERARRLGTLGYAHRSRVPHKCGTTIGGTGNRGARSPLSVYLAARNTILFVQAKHPIWLPWSLVAQTAQLAAYCAVGAFHNAVIGFKGLTAGLRGETGRPDKFFESTGPNPQEARSFESVAGGNSTHAE